MFSEIGSAKIKCAWDPDKNAGVGVVLYFHAGMNLSMEGCMHPRNKAGMAYFLGLAMTSDNTDRRSVAAANLSILVQNWATKVRGTNLDFFRPHRWRAPSSFPGMEHMMAVVAVRDLQGYTTTIDFMPGDLFWCAM